MSAAEQLVDIRMRLMDMHFKHLKDFVLSTDFDPTDQRLGTRTEQSIREWKELYAFLAQLDRSRREAILIQFHWELQMLIKHYRIEAGQASHSTM